VNYLAFWLMGRIGEGNSLNLSPTDNGVDVGVFLHNVGNGYSGNTLFTNRICYTLQRSRDLNPQPYISFYAQIKEVIRENSRRGKRTRGCGVGGQVELYVHLFLRIGKSPRTPSILRLTNIFRSLESTLSNRTPRSDCHAFRTAHGEEVTFHITIMG
jgi:hypothetical protein